MLTTRRVLCACSAEIDAANAALDASLERCNACILLLLALADADVASPLSRGRPALADSTARARHLPPPNAALAFPVTCSVLPVCPAVASLASVGGARARPCAVRVDVTAVDSLGLDSGTWSVSVCPCVLIASHRPLLSWCNALRSGRLLASQASLRRILQRRR